MHPSDLVSTQGLLRLSTITLYQSSGILFKPFYRARMFAPAGVPCRYSTEIHTILLLSLRLSPSACTQLLISSSSRFLSLTSSAPSQHHAWDGNTAWKGSGLETHRCVY
eukprot:768292-Hanusia_phi.AAC.5